MKPLYQARDGRGGCPCCQRFTSNGDTANNKGGKTGARMKAKRDIQKELRTGGRDGLLQHS